MVVNNHESLDWWAKMSPVFEEYLAESYLCDLWFVCSDRIVSAHKLVLAQLGDWEKKSSTFLACLESEESFITMDDWTGDQVTQIMIEIYNTETKSLGSETKVLLNCLGIKFEEDFRSLNLDTSFDYDIISHNLDISDESDNKSPTLDISYDSDISCNKEESINVVKYVKEETAGISLDVSLNQCIVCSCSLMTHSKITEKSKLEYICCIKSCKSNFSFTTDFVGHMNEHAVDLEFGVDFENAVGERPDVQRLCCLCNVNRMQHRIDKETINFKYKDNFYKCCKCSASNLSAKSFFQHVENHLDEKFPCGKCETAFASQYLLDKHNKDLHISSVKITFNCLYDGCDYRAKCKQTLNTHVRDVHLGIPKSVCISKDTRPMKCPSCLKSMKIWYYEKYHKKTCGENSVVYQCDICNKSGFVNSVTLQNHVRAAHSDEKPFTCEHCDKTFARSESLSKHRALNHGVNHKGEVIARKFYSCNYCGKLLTSKTKLVSHVKVIHEGVKDFKCKFCDKTFGSKSNLEVHEGAVHTGKLPYQCYFCNKSFSRKNLLNDHQETHTKETETSTKPKTSKTVHFDKVQYVTHLDTVDNQEIVDSLERDEPLDHLVVSEQIMEVDVDGEIKEIVEL